MKKCLVNSVGLALFLVVLSGCAMGRKFKESKSVNFAPFAEHTLVLLASLNYDLNPNEVYLITPYVDMNSPVVAHLQTSVKLERAFLKGVMAYSSEIVNLSESGKSQEEQVKEYKNYIGSLSREVQSESLADVLMPSDKVKVVLDSIGQKKTLLESMQAARPLIVEFNKVNIRLIRDIGFARSELAALIHQNIDAKFKVYIEADQSLRVEKSDVLAGLNLLRSQKLGDASAWRQLSSIKGLLPKSISGQDSYSIEKYLNDRLAVLTKRQEAIQPDLALYRELKAKLDDIRARHDEMIRAGGRAVLLWSQAHQKMANGITNPAEWFGMGDLKSMVTGAAKKAVP